MESTDGNNSQRGGVGWGLSSASYQSSFTGVHGVCENVLFLRDIGKRLQALGDASYSMNSWAIACCQKDHSSV